MPGVLAGRALSVVAFLTLLVIFIGDLSTPRDVTLASLAVVPVAVVAWSGESFYRPLLAVAVAMSFVAAALGGISLQSAAAVAAACVALTIVIRVAAPRASQIQGQDHAMQPFGANGAQAEVARGGTDRTLERAGVRRAQLRPLTSREQQVVQLAAEGLTAREIGARLFIGERTVETHLANSYSKLGVGSKRELMRSARLRVS